MKTTGSNLILRLDVADDVSSGGILIPDKAKEKLNTGIVKSIGPKVEVVRVGDHVLISNFGGQAIMIDGEKLLHVVVGVQHRRIIG